MKSKSLIVVGLGASTWDQFLLCPDFPDHEGVTQTLESAEQGGGPVATALCVMSSLGIDTEMIDSLGCELRSQWIKSEFERYGVSCRFLQEHSKARSSTATILVRKGDGQRHILFYPTNAPAPSLTREIFETVAGAQLFHCNGRYENEMNTLIRHARDQKTLVSFDGGAHRYRPALDFAVEKADILIVAKQFAEAYSGSSDISVQAQLLLKHGARVVSITDGTQGSHHWFEGAYHFQESIPAKLNKDTTGCGDVFHGAMLYGILQSWRSEETTSFAARIASKNAEGLGGRYVLTLPDFPFNPPLP